MKNRIFNLFNEKFLLMEDKMERLIIFYDNNDNCFSFYENEIPDTVKQMKIERYLRASEKLVVIKVEGVINE